MAQRPNLLVDKRILSRQVHQLHFVNGFINFFRHRQPSRLPLHRHLLFLDDFDPTRGVNRSVRANFHALLIEYQLPVLAQNRPVIPEFSTIIGRFSSWCDMGMAN